MREQRGTLRLFEPNQALTGGACRGSDEQQTLKSKYETLEFDCCWNRPPNRQCSPPSSASIITSYRKSIFDGLTPNFPMHRLMPDPGSSGSSKIGVRSTFEPTAKLTPIFKRGMHGGPKREKFVCP